MRKLMVISVDSMITEDIGVIRKLPNFERILKDSSVVRNVLTTYPSLTHSVHPSIATGCRPWKHGAFNNELFQPFNEEPDWFDTAGQLKTEAVWDVFRKAGRTTALISWPVSSGADADWVLHRPGVGGPHRFYSGPEDEMIHTSTPGIYTGKLYERCHPAWSLPHYYDWDFCTSNACAVILEDHVPDLLLTHFTLVDAIRHREGVFSSDLISAYEYIDEQLGLIWDVLDRKGLWDEYIIAFTSDHGHIDATRITRPNILFAQAGYIDLDPENNVTDWKIYCHGSDFFMPVYVRDHDPALKEEALRILGENMEKLGISEFLSKDYAYGAYGLDGDFDFLCDTDGGTLFYPDCKGPLELTRASGVEFPRASHGYRPEKGPRPMMFLRVPGRPGGKTLESGRIIDQMPTFAKLAGLEMPDAEGRPVEALL